ncbi:phage tail protein [Pararhodobacter zhoushanensis]|uniref:phage tail protein n=1 Tax=Pararhodobacter zhoushanensis TaxID=2479545 RepID=UPI000F8D8120|nr:phage tail protein [Pararhodobacter zhoushanensis]
MIRTEIDWQEIKAAADHLGATEKQVGMAISRALSRTAGTMRARASRALRKGLDVRRANTLRKRLRELRAGRRTRGSSSGQQLREISLWIGLNDLAVSDLKGRPAKTATGAEFRGRTYQGAFVAVGKKGARTIYKRAGRGRFPISEQTFPIKDRADVILEDDVFDDLVDVFMKNFMSDLRARVLHGVGRQRGN